VRKSPDRQQHAFSLERRERFLALLAVGKSIEEAAAVVCVSRTTIARWCARGRIPAATTEHAWFAERYDAIRATRIEDVAPPDEPEPTEDDGFLDIFASDPNDALYDPAVRRMVEDRRGEWGRRSER
jgi:hypothetical protein